METSLEKIRGLVRLIRGIQLCPLSYPEFISSVGVANGDMYHNGASKPSSSNAVTTDTNNNTNNTTSSSEATVMISTHTSASDTLNLIATNNNTVKTDTSNTKGITSSKETEDSTLIKSVARIKGEYTNSTAFSNNSSNQGVPITNGTVSAGEENIKKHKNNNNSDLSVIPQALLGPVVPLTEVTEGVK